MSTVTTFVRDQMTDEQRHAVIKSYEQYERDGFIGDEPVRLFAQQLMKYLGDSSEFHIVLWMNQLAFECYKYFYHKIYWPLTVLP